MQRPSPRPPGTAGGNLALSELVSLVTAALGLRKELLGSGPMRSDLEVFVDDYEGEAPGDPRRVFVLLKGESASKWAVSGIEALGPRRFLRPRRRWKVAPEARGRPEWAKRLAFRSPGDRCMFWLHDEAPRDIEVRVHACGRFNPGRKARSDIPYKIYADTIDWGGGHR